MFRIFPGTTTAVRRSGLLRSRIENRMIAVVGFSARSAGSSDADEFWQIVAGAVPQFAPAPFDRWREDSVLSHERSRPFTSYTNTMAALEDPYGWDRAGFGIPVARARGMDPQQRLALTLARETFDRAGRTPESVAGRGIGTIVGVSSNDYRMVTVAPVIARMTTDGSFGVDDPEVKQRLMAGASSAIQRIGGYSMSGVLNNIIPSVVQQQFDLNGPSFSVDSACSSGLTAIHLACTLIESGEVDECLAGGVYVALTPDVLIAFAQVGALSPTGRCQPFTAAADGFTLGEGGALLLLKNLELARRDNDPIYAVIEGWGASSDGRAPGIMTPTSEGQVRAIRAARRRAGGDLPVDYIEGHGTGTTVGDAQEILSVAGTDPDPAGPGLPIGSVKAIAGHTLAASGALSMVKAVQMIRHQTVPPQPPVRTGVHPGLESTRLHVAGHRDRNRDVRRIAINSFGFGGANGHLLVSHPEGTL